MLLNFINAIDWAYAIVDHSSYLILFLAFVGVLQWLYLTSKKNWYKYSLHRSVFYTLAIVFSLSILNLLADWHAREKIQNAELNTAPKKKVVDLNLTLKGNRYSSDDLKALAEQHRDPASALRGYELLAEITRRDEITATNIDDVISFMRSVDENYHHITSRQAVKIVRNTLLASANALYAGMDHPNISPRLEPSLDELYASAPDDTILVLQLEKE